MKIRVLFCPFQGFDQTREPYAKGNIIANEISTYFGYKRIKLFYEHPDVQLNKN